MAGGLGLHHGVVTGGQVGEGVRAIRSRGRDGDHRTVVVEGVPLTLLDHNGAVVSSRNTVPEMAPSTTGSSWGPNSDVADASVAVEVSRPPDAHDDAGSDGGSDSTHPEKVPPAVVGQSPMNVRPSGCATASASPASISPLWSAGVSSPANTSTVDPPNTADPPASPTWPPTVTVFADADTTADVMTG